jgi:hypothetical protein
MTYAWGILTVIGSGAAGFYAGARYVGVTLAKILAKLTDAQLARLADQVAEERRRGRTG